MTIAKTEDPAVGAAQGFGGQTGTIKRHSDTVSCARQALRAIANTRDTGLRGAA